ncbi:hypothetical protein BKA57DRAFT_162635 [Linnemannia elongata]|nr:hypothetical protein BKA57DRAFT_162635 [Linnemannia elongata]
MYIVVKVSFVPRSMVLLPASNVPDVLPPLFLTLYSLRSFLLPLSPFTLVRIASYKKVDPRFYFCNTYSYSISLSLLYSQIVVYLFELSFVFLCLFLPFFHSFIPHSVCLDFLSFAFNFPSFLHSHSHSSRSGLTDLCLPSGSFLFFFHAFEFISSPPNPQCIHQSSKTNPPPTIASAISSSSTPAYKSDRIPPYPLTPIHPSDTYLPHWQRQ